jgi:hypothetical protein
MIIMMMVTLVIVKVVLKLMVSTEISRIIIAGVMMIEEMKE